MIVDDIFDDFKTRFLKILLENAVYEIRDLPIQSQHLRIKDCTQFDLEGNYL